MEKYCVQILKKLVNIESINGNEKKVMQFVEKELQSFGLKTKRYNVTKDRFNVWARIGRGRPVLCLNAHADTVLPSGKSVPKAVEKNGNIYGLGSCDDKAGIAAILTCAREIAKDPPEKGALDVLISVDEEGGGKGVLTAIKKGYRCNYAIVGELSGLDIVRANSGLIFLKLKTSGVSHHGSKPWAGINAIERMLGLVNNLKKFLCTYKKHELIGPFSINLGAIKGGDIANRVPDYCEALVDIRLTPPHKSADVLKKVKAVIEKYGRADFEVMKQKEPMETEADSRFIGILKKIVKKERGIAPKIRGNRGWMEASFFRNMLGVDAVVVGAGSLTGPHSSNESVITKTVIKTARIYIAAAKALPELK